MKSNTLNRGILSNVDMKKGSNKLIYTGIVAVVLIICTICVIPVIWILLSGFKTPSEMYKVPATFFPEAINLKKLYEAWIQMKFYNYYINSFILAGGVTLTNLLISGFAGYVLSKLKPKGNSFLFNIIFWTTLIPGTMSTVPIYMSIIDVPLLGINLSNSFLPIWLMGVNAFDIILFKNAFDGISNSIMEAATIDGAGRIETFFRIIVPMSIPVFMTIMIFSFNGSIGSYFWPYLLISDKSMTVLGVALYRMKSSTFSLDYQMLAVIFAIIPQVLVFTFFQKNIVGGISIGAVKE